MLSVLGSLNYKPWFAVAEFVDNALQSRSEHISLQSNPLRVEIDISTRGDGSLSITDNAGGIALADFPRAFRPAAAPSDRTGLSEFGMGMKSAASWFGNTWSVRTSPLGDPNEYSVEFDIAGIVEKDNPSVAITSIEASPNAHYTQVVISQLNKVPAGRTVAKIREHLADIYRVFLRKNELVLLVNQVPITGLDFAVLQAPIYDNPAGDLLSWKKDVEFDFGDGLRVVGFAGLLATGKQALAGFSLFRRGRVIEGSGDQRYKPPLIFGAGNTYRSQRLFGELHLEGFDVSHTKDGFLWQDNELPFLELLNEHLDDGDLPLLLQAENFRARAPERQQARIATAAVDRTVRVMEGALVAATEALYTAEVEAPKLSADSEAPSLVTRQLDVVFRGTKWNLNVTAVAGHGPWMTYADSGITSTVRRIDIEINFDHKFLIRFAQRESESAEAIVRLGCAIAISDIVARTADLPQGAVKRNISDLLDAGLSH